MKMNGLVIFSGILVLFMAICDANARMVNHILPRDLTRPNRIVGGKPVKSGEFPWQVSLKTMGSHFCGATLVSKNWLVTAAHCTKDINYKYVRAVLGAWNLNARNIEYKINKVIVAKFKQATMQNDIALLRLSNQPSQKVKGARAGKPIRFESKQEISNRTAIISGWGKEKSGTFATPHILRSAKVFLQADVKCQTMLSRSTSYRIFNTNLCAGGSNRDACQGDSGGPLVICDSPTMQPDSCRIAGIVSWGVGCATKGIPGIYTEVAHYRQWIINSIKKHDGAHAPSEESLFFSYSHDEEATGDDSEEVDDTEDSDEESEEKNSQEESEDEGSMENRKEKERM